MEINSAFINELIAAILEGAIISYIYYALFGKKYFSINDRINTVLFIIAYSILSMWSTLNVPPMYNTVLLTAFSIIILSIITSTKPMKALIAVLICCIYFVIVELLTLAVATLISGIDHFNLANLKNDIVLLTYTAKFLQWFIIFLIIKFNKIPIRIHGKKDEEDIPAYWLVGMFLMALFIAVEIVSEEETFRYYIILMAFFFIFVILGMFDYRKKLELVKIKNNYHLKQEYVNNLEVIIDIIRKEKHDFANHINIIYAMCIMDKEDSLDRIKEYLKGITTNLKDSYKFYDTGNSYVDGLIAVKSNYAFENNIFLDIDFETDLDVIMIGDNDLVAIIGNILDNALYAVSTGEKDKEKIVSIYGYLQGNKYILSISNNGPMVPKEIGNKIFKKGFSTKKQNKDDHGFGLYIVSGIVKKNGGQIVFSSSIEETEFLIELRVKEGFYEENCNSSYKCNI